MTLRTPPLRTSSPPATPAPLPPPPAARKTTSGPPATARPTTSSTTPRSSPAPPAISSAAPPMRPSRSATSCSATWLRWQELPASSPALSLRTWWRPPWGLGPSSRFRTRAARPCSWVGLQWGLRRISGRRVSLSILTSRILRTATRCRPVSPACSATSTACETPSSAATAPSTATSRRPPTSPTTICKNSRSGPWTPCCRRLTGSPKRSTTWTPS
mmetsp:Transcript_98350/g.262840  ORF Transcript_98350/g.262840 Transcript_98350/m.262840 type:complete len:216 (-) Transcript_98350:986-1633(-)